MVLIRGLMADNTKVTGTMASNTVKVFINSLRGRIAEAAGRKERELLGWMSSDQQFLFERN